MQSSGYFPHWICALFACMGGCFGCFTKPTLIIAVDEPSKGPTIQGRKVNKRSFSDDYWSSSASEMVLSSSNQPLDPSASTSPSSEFINHGLLLWHQTRQQWLKNERPEKREQLRDPVISWNATYESLLGNNKRFPQPIPLSEMVDFLVDVWDQEGLYD